MDTQAPLLPLVRKYFESDPASAAHHLEVLDENEALETFKSLPPEVAAKAVPHLNDEFAAMLLQGLPEQVFKEIVERLDVQQGTAIFLRLPNEKRAQFLMPLDVKRKKEIQELLTYPEDSAGRIMSTNLLAFHGDTTVETAIEKIRQLAKKGTATTYAYVVGEEHHLIGVMNMRDMMLASPQAQLNSVVRKDIFAVDCFMDREKVAEELSRRKYFAAPVVDQQSRLLGVVKSDQLIQDVKEEAAEDLQKMFGVGGDEKAFSPISFSLKKRLPWLHINLVTAFLAASVVALFEDVIAKITVLAVYLPVVAGQGGNAGAQSLAIVMRGLVMREIRPNRAKILIMKETWIGVVNGLVIGLVTAGVAWLWQGNPYLGLVIGLGMLVNLTIAGLAGATIPLGMKALGLDPAQCSNIILTTVTDVMGFFSFLGFAVLFQSHLI
jgi:magnesium transporter